MFITSRLNAIVAPQSGSEQKSVFVKYLNNQIKGKRKEESKREEEKGGGEEEQKRGERLA